MTFFIPLNPADIKAAAPLCVITAAHADSISNLTVEFPEKPKSGWMAADHISVLNIPNIIHNQNRFWVDFKLIKRQVFIFCASGQQEQQ
jgi:hypothetical protein